MLEETGAMAFLRAHLPETDLAAYPPELFEAYVRHGLMLRRTVPWCAALEEEIFLHYVLFPRVNDEDLSFHRQIFYEALWPRVKDLSPEEAVLEVNRWCAETACYESTDARTASPLTVFRCGSGRCGEESAFLVSALRSVGLPARQVYVPLWSHCDDNHAWVEALCGTRWRFLGACEPEPALDRGWFNASASRAPLVRSRLFGAGASPLHGAPIGQDGAVTFYNQTARYAPVTERVFAVRANGRPAPGAVIRLEILNEAAFGGVAVLTAGEDGDARAELGPGTIHALALWRGLRAEGDSGGGTLTLDLVPPTQEDTGWLDFDFSAAQPAPVHPAPLDRTQRAVRGAVRRACTARCSARTAAFAQAGDGQPQWRDLLEWARGNRGEILAFLSGADAPDRERLLRTLPDKDLRDTSCEILEDHFSRLPPRRAEVPEEIYWKYLACPRVGREKLTAWRSGDYGAMDGAQRRIAGLRRQGVPARLRPLDGAPEAWEDGAFRPLVPEETAALRLTCPAAPDRACWSLSRRTAEGWRRLELSDFSWEDGILTAALPAGYYRLVTAVRLPGGGQLGARRDFPLRSGQERTEALRLRTYRLGDTLFRQPMPPTPAETLDGGTAADLFRLAGRPALLLWLEEGEEPTEHLLLELSARRAAFRALPLEMVLLLRSRESAAHPSAARLLEGWPEARVLLDDWAFDLEDFARRLVLDPDTPPLSVLCDGEGNAVYGLSGYRVGAADLLLRAAEALGGG